MNSNDVVEIVREAAELACQNLQRVLNETLDYTKSFEWNEISESLLIKDSTIIKMKRIRDKEDDDWGTYDPNKKWAHGKEEKKKDQKEEEVEVLDEDIEEEDEEEEEEKEEEDESEELPFPKHPSSCCGITWESIAEVLKQGALPSTLYKNLPREAYFAFKMCIIEGHIRFLKNKVHLSRKQIDESDEILESFIPLQDLIAYCFDNNNN
jgi:hypothetical protein